MGFFRIEMDRDEALFLATILKEQRSEGRLYELGMELEGQLEDYDNVIRRRRLPTGGRPKRKEG